jgi:hypothetical protein
MTKLFDVIISDIMRIEQFASYKFRKRDSMLIHKKDGMRQSIELDHWIDDSSSSLVIYPIYGVRFEILHKWFEKFSVNTLQDQRDRASISFSGDMLCQQEEFYFKLEKGHYKDDFYKLQTQLLKCSEYVFSTYSSLEKLYANVIEPIFNKNAQLLDVGADWIFFDLALCKLIQPEKYDQLKQILVEHMKFLYKRGEPNVLDYYDQLEDILSYLENTEHLE